MVHINIGQQNTKYKHNKGICQIQLEENNLMISIKIIKLLLLTYMSQV